MVNHPKIGDKVNKLTLLGKIKVNNVKRWVCVCTCGNKRIVPLSTISSKRVTACRQCKGKPQNGNNNHMWAGYKDLSATFITQNKSNAKRYGYCFNITIKDIYNKFIEQDFKCFYTGKPISFNIQDTKITRRDNNLGYTYENTVIVANHISGIKRDITENDLFEWSKLIFQKSSVENNSYKNISLKTIKYQLTEVIKRAKRRNIDYKLYDIDVYNRYIEQKGKCYISGLPINFVNEAMMASIDRIDSNGIYELSNIALCHRQINFMKLDLSLDEFIQIMKDIYIWLSTHSLIQKN